MTIVPRLLSHLRGQTLPLFECVETYVPFYEKIYKVSDAKTHFDRMVDDHHLTEDKRTSLLTEKGGTTPLSFLRALYPSQNTVHVGSLVRLLSIDHDALFKEYKKLSTLMIDPHHLNEFMGKFLTRKFKRPSSMLQEGKGPSAIVHGFLKLEKYRNKYVSQLNTIIDDFKRQGIPISNQERNQLLYYTFFRDKYDIHEAIDVSFDYIGKSFRYQNKFNWDTYKLIRKSLDDEESLNNLLEISILNNNRGAIEDLTSMNLNRYSIMLLMKYFCSDQYKGSDKYSRFENLIQIVIDKNLVIDTLLFNEMLNGFCKFDDFDAVSKMSEVLVLNNDDIYKGLTSKSIDIYKTHLRYYDYLAVMDIPKLAIIPNVATFTPLLKYHTQFNKIIEVIEKIKSFGLPITTKSFKIIFSKPYTLPELHELLYYYLDQFEMHNAFDHDVSNKNPTNLQGNFVKIPDEMVKIIVECIRRSLEISLDNKRYQRINELYYHYDQLTDTLRDYRKTTKSKDFFTINQSTYLKYAFIIEQTINMI